MARSMIRFVPLLPTLALPVLLCAEVSVRENNRSVVHTCTAEENVMVAGNNNNVQLSGPCGEVTVAGNRNRLALGQARSIITPGNDNRVMWSVGKPQISNPGSRNQIGPATGAAAHAGSTGAHARPGELSDGAGNSVRTNPNGSTTVTDAAGNTVTTQPHY